MTVAVSTWPTRAGGVGHARHARHSAAASTPRGTVVGSTPRIEEEIEVST